ncbi:hypothetical protein GUJ93_ZPchr0002g23045 [Zizania palustris]|uniref:Uncharacterized protein n=1 Tax=Zizania palustris TaxID=103762 RepID=A0A8J5VBZ1_ZIZPA|nr:hypothetical protein GUJ93_ZPchr0002g23045 [Zizania palustris]
MGDDRSPLKASVVVDCRALAAWGSGSRPLRVEALGARGVGGSGARPTGDGRRAMGDGRSRAGASAVGGRRRQGGKQGFSLQARR